MRRRLLMAAVVGVILLLGWVGYRFANREAFVSKGVLSPPAEQVTFAGSTPEHPFKLEAGNILSRSVFRTSGPSNSQIEVRDVMLPPHAKGQLGPLPGPALLDAYAGQGTISFGDVADQFSAGHMRSVPAGRALAFENSGSYPMVLRLYVFEAK
jgi:hypothetical protein